MMLSLLPVFLCSPVMQVASAKTLEATANVPEKGADGVAREAEIVTTPNKLKTEATIRARLIFGRPHRLLHLCSRRL